MAEWVDLLDSANQKYDNQTSGLTATDVQAAIDELDAKPAPTPDLTDAEFPTYAVFAARYTNLTAAVDFANGNKQVVNAANFPNVTVAGPAGHPANFMLAISNSNNLASIASASEGPIQWEGGSPPAWAGLSILALYYDGTVWYGSAMVDVA